MDSVCTEDDTEEPSGKMGKHSCTHISPVITSRTDRKGGTRNGGMMVWLWVVARANQFHQEEANSAYLAGVSVREEVSVDFLKLLYG